MLRRFRRFLIMIGIGLLLALPALAQELPTELYACGVALNSAATPNVQGWITHGNLVGNGFYFLQSYDVSPIPHSSTPVAGLNIPKLQSQARLGTALYLRNLSKRVMLFGLGDAGIAADGESIGSSLSGGGMAVIALGKGFSLPLGFRIIRNSETGTTYVPQIGVIFSSKK